MDTDKTHLSRTLKDNIFCGQYYDEFACVGFLGNPEKETISVLMLGLGEGKGVMPILISPRVFHLHIVDFDETIINRFDASHPDLSNCGRVKYTLSDAADFLSTSTDKFDVIIIDLYTHTEYSALMTDGDIYDTAICLLNTSGHLLMNSFGVPMNLDPFIGQTPQRWLSQSLRKNFKTIHYLPHRRNATFIMGAPLSNLSNGMDNTQPVSVIDMVFISLMKARLEHMKTVPDSLVSKVPPRLDFTGIDLEMQDRWLKLLPILSKWLPQQFALQNTRDLRALLNNPEACTDLQLRLLYTSESFRWTLPLLLAGEAASAHLNAIWFAEWIISELELQNSIDNELWLEALIPQSHALIAASQTPQGLSIRFNQALLTSQVLPIR